MDVDELEQRLEAFVIVDAREGFEHRHSHVPGALLFPPGEAWQRAEELPADRPLAVVCGDQTRSAYVASILERRGRDARLVMGGMVDWLERGYPIEKEPLPAA
jgi:rhodanese-related sulfurtransferase